MVITEGGLRAVPEIVLILEGRNVLPVVRKPLHGVAGGVKINDKIYSE
jgi:hypothetical protein